MGRYTSYQGDNASIRRGSFRIPVPSLTQGSQRVESGRRRGSRDPCGNSASRSKQSYWGPAKAGKSQRGLLLNPYSRLTLLLSKRREYIYGDGTKTWLTPPPLHTHTHTNTPHTPIQVTIKWIAVDRVELNRHVPSTGRIISVEVTPFPINYSIPEGEWVLQTIKHLQLKLLGGPYGMR